MEKICGNCIKFDGKRYKTWKNWGYCGHHGWCCSEESSCGIMRRETYLLKDNVFIRQRNL